MKKYVRLIAFLSAFLLLASSICACSAREAEPSTGPAQTDVPGAPSSAPTDTPDGIDPTVEQWEYGSVSLPICEEPIILSYWINANTSVMGLVTDYADLPGYKYLAELTGIELEFQYYDRNQKETQLNLMIAGGELTDFITGIGNTYSGGLDKALEDDIIVDLTPYADTLMQNYVRVCQGVEEYSLNMTTDSGRILQFCCFQSTDRPVVMGPTVRADWLDRIGMAPEDIVTYEDYHEMLTRFKTELGADAAVLIGASGVPDHNYLAAGYDVTVYSETDEGGTGSAMPFVQIDGTVKYSPLESGYLEYLTMMNQWYAEGLVYTDFMSQTFPTTMFDLVSSGRTGLFYPYSVMFEMVESMNDDPEFELVGIMDAVKHPGDVNHLRRSSDLYEGEGTSITTNCEYLEEAILYCDMMYTAQGDLIYNYGVEDLSYEMADGEPVYTEAVTANMDNLSSEDAIVYFTAGVCGVQSNSNRMQMWADHVIDAVNTWASFDNSYSIPYGVSLTAEEAAQFNEIYADIATYVSENTLAFIIGEKPLSDYEEFTAQIESSGISRCVEIYQAALDRYYARQS